MLVRKQNDILTQKLKEIDSELTDVVSIAFETNGKGYIGFIVELPGAFIRGRTEKEAVAKVNQEVNLYLRWLGIEQKHEYEIQVVQRHRSSLMVEDADNEILLEADKKMMEEEEFRNFLDLIRFSGEDFLQLYTNTKFKDWIDEARIRKTFYGDNPKTIQEIFDHVKYCQNYYLSGMKIIEEIEGDFRAIRKFCVEKLEALYRKNNNSLIFETDNELWTLKKVLRRFIWHDRIHGKAMIRILEKQKQLGVIDEYDDPFHFMEAPSYSSE
jgi:predicted RNase H-like HicB family nuclease